MEWTQAIGVVRHTGTTKGRGVFAPRDIDQGEVVELCPAIVIRVPFDDLPAELQQTVFCWGRLARTDESFAVALGYGGMYNHANPANLRYEAVPDCDGIRFTAARAIRSGEELTVNYEAEGGGHVCDDEGHWFETVGVTPYRE